MRPHGPQCRLRLPGDEQREARDMARFAFS